MGETSLINYNANDFVEIENEEFEDEEIEEYNENKNISIRVKGGSKVNIWSKSRLAQIDECQLKLFGKEQPKTEYYFNKKTNEIIMEYYKNENSDFKEAAERRKQKKRKRKDKIKQKKTDVIFYVWGFPFKK